MINSLVANKIRNTNFLFQKNSTPTTKKIIGNSPQNYLIAGTLVGLATIGMIEINQPKQEEKSLFPPLKPSEEKTYPDVFNFEQLQPNIYYTPERNTAVFWPNKIGYLIPKDHTFKCFDNGMVIYDSEGKLFTPEQYQKSTIQYHEAIPIPLHDVPQVPPAFLSNLTVYTPNSKKGGELKNTANTQYIPNQLEPASPWQYANSSNFEIIPWKMHIFIDDSNPEDWNKMTSCIVPYLQDRDDVNFKMAKNYNHLKNTLGLNIQKGKGIVIYPQSKSQFEDIAQDISTLVRVHGLSTENGNVIGDKELGNTGRIFYRYEDVTKKTYSYNPETGEELNHGYNPLFYDANRGNGENSYLANDMTIEDDIFKDFNPDM